MSKGTVEITKREHDIALRIFRASERAVDKLFACKGPQAYRAREILSIVLDELEPGMWGAESMEGDDGAELVRDPEELARDPDATEPDTENPNDCEKRARETNEPEYSDDHAIGGGRPD